MCIQVNKIKSFMCSNISNIATGDVSVVFLLSQRIKKTHYNQLRGRKYIFLLKPTLAWCSKASVWGCTFMFNCVMCQCPSWDLWPKLTSREQWGRWMDATKCLNNCFSCLRPWNKEPRPKCSSALACCVTVCVCVHVCLQPCMMTYKQSSALAPCTTAAVRGFSHHLSPPTLYFLSPTYSSFHLLRLLLLSLTNVWPKNLVLLLLLERFFNTRLKP